MPEKHVLKKFPSNNYLEIFNSIIGSWTTTGTHGMIPNKILHGTTTFEWHESKAFVVIHTTIQEDVGIPDGVAIIGSDDMLNRCTMIYYDEKGISRNYQVSIDGNCIQWIRKEPGLFQRNTLSISEDNQTIIGKGEISKDGVTWEQDLDLTYLKAAAN